ncbi:MAG: hypothetical protein ABL872_15305, partial [Lacibacter sp.]
FDLYTYYAPFGIEIHSYINISEILLLVFPTILNGLFAILLIIISLAIGLRNKTNQLDPKTKELITALDEYDSSVFHFKQNFKSLKGSFKPFHLKNTFSIFLNTLSILFELSFVLLLFIIGHGIYTIFVSESLEIYPLNRLLRFAFFYLFSFFFFVPVFLLLSEYFEKYSHKIFSGLTLVKIPVIYFVIGFVVNSLISNRIQYLYITNGHSNKDVSFTYNDNKIKTDSNFVYIGSTQSYIFIRNNNDSLSLIIKKDEIKNLTIKEKYDKLKK